MSIRLVHLDPNDPFVEQKLKELDTSLRVPRGEMAQEAFFAGLDMDDIAYPEPPEE